MVGSESDNEISSEFELKGEVSAKFSSFLPQQLQLAFSCRAPMAAEIASTRLQQVQEILAPSLRPSSWFTLTLPNLITVQLTQVADSLNVEIEGDLVVSFRASQRLKMLQTVATPGARSLPTPHLHLVAESKTKYHHVWAALYALLTASPSTKTILSISPSPSSSTIKEYLLNSGLATPLAGLTADDVIISQAAFWQGAGSPHGGWLNPTGKAFMSSTPFPFIPSFTRLEKVITAHPLRSPKPKPGDIVYQRWIKSMGKFIAFVVVDPFDNNHVDALNALSTDGKGTSDWAEMEGVDRGARDYLELKRADPHVLSLVGFWEGETRPFGYFEVFWAREDPLNAFIGSADDYDRGLRSLVEEAQVQNFEYRQGWVSSLAHLVFLSDPRTMRIVMEVTAEPSLMMSALTEVGFYLEKEFDSHTGHYGFVVLNHERFFQNAYRFS